MRARAARLAARVFTSARHHLIGGLRSPAARLDRATHIAGTEISQLAKSALMKSPTIRLYVYPARRLATTDCEKSRGTERTPFYSFFRLTRPKLTRVRGSMCGTMVWNSLPFIFASFRLSISLWATSALLCSVNLTQKAARHKRPTIRDDRAVRGRLSPTYHLGVTCPSRPLEMRGRSTELLCAKKWSKGAKSDLSNSKILRQGTL